MMQAAEDEIRVTAQKISPTSGVDGAARAPTHWRVANTD